MGLGMKPIIKVLKSRSNRWRLDKVKHSPPKIGTYGDTGFTVDKLNLLSLHQDTCSKGEVMYRVTLYIRDHLMYPTIIGVPKMDP